MWKVEDWRPLFATRHRSIFILRPRTLKQRHYQRTTRSTSPTTNYYVQSRTMPGSGILRKTVKSYERCEAVMQANGTHTRFLLRLADGYAYLSPYEPASSSQNAAYSQQF